MVYATRLMQLSQKFRKFITQQFAPLIKESGLSMREFHILLFLINNPDYDTARDVTELRGLVKSQVSQAVELLCVKELLLRKTDPDDRRVVHLQMTDAGHKLALRAQALQSFCYGQLLKGFTQKEEAQFYSLLTRVLDNGDSLDTFQS